MKIDFKYTVWTDVNWVKAVQDVRTWLILVQFIIILWAAQMIRMCAQGEEFLASQGEIYCMELVT
jgi:hypothetical protein